MIYRILLSLLLFVSVAAEAAIGEWTSHASYHNVTKCEKMGDRLYVLASGALFSYSKEDGELCTYDNISTLSDIDIAFISYCKEIDALVIVYGNANIDLLYSDESVYNIPDFKNSTLTDKTINNISVTGSKAYLATNLGVVEMDLEKKEFSNTYTLGRKVYNCGVYDNHIYIGTDGGAYRGCMDDNLLDSSNWSYLNKYKNTFFVEFGGSLYCIIENLGIYTIDTEKNRLTLVQGNNGSRFTYMYTAGNRMIAGGTDKTAIFEADGSHTVYGHSGNSIYMYADGNTLWNCKGYKGLVECAIENGNIVEKSDRIIPDSPVRNYCEFLKLSGDRLFVTGGNLNYLDTKFHEGTVMEYDCIDGTWTNYPEDIIKESTGLGYYNVCSMDEDPNEEGHCFASSFGYGLYEFRNGEFVKHYNHENSPLESVNSGVYASRYVRIPKVWFDDDGNLWCINTGVSNIIKILKTDGSWHNLYYKGIDCLPTVSDILFDSRGWMWVVSLQADAGLFCVKTNGTPMNSSDDETKGWFSKFTNQDGTSYDIYQIYAFVEDLNGMLWVGTNIGLFVIDNPKKFFEEGTFTQIKIPRNDGTGLADYLLNGVYIQTIFVDDADRKWIGTKQNGVYLISADGQETIHHFTTDNSPLPSNSVVSIAANRQTGEVFIGTEKGLVSYMSDATEAMPVLKESNVYAYPNPVRADYTGNITVVGLTFGCNVKITDSSGNLIAEGTSVGGSFTWNGCNSSGNRVASGVYYVLAYDEDGNEGVATKILVVR